MKNIVVLLILLLTPISYSQAQGIGAMPGQMPVPSFGTLPGQISAPSFGTPPGRMQTSTPQQQIVANTNQPSFVVIPLYRMNPELIANLMGGDVIWDTGGGSGSGGNSGYGSNSSSG